MNTVKWPLRILSLSTSIFLFLISSVAVAAIDANLNATIQFIANSQITDDMNSNTRVGEEICKAGGGNFCTGASIGEGICKAGGGNFCTGASIGEGICKAGGGNFCTGASVGEGICKARNGSYCAGMETARALSLPIVDKDWEWDQFRNPNSYSRIWACRGISTGQFADDNKCALKPKVDTTWPNN